MKRRDSESAELAPVPLALGNKLTPRIPKRFASAKALACLKVVSGVPLD
jgi:hypothetical protein